MSSTPKPTPLQIETKIFELLEEREASASICPSEVARSLDADDWRGLMPGIRAVVDRLSQRKLILITQKDKTVESAKTAIGPIRLRLVR